MRFPLRDALAVGAAVGGAGFVAIPMAHALVSLLYTGTVSLAPGSLRIGIIGVLALVSYSAFLTRLPLGRSLSVIAWVTAGCTIVGVIAFPLGHLMGRELRVLSLDLAVLTSGALLLGLIYRYAPRKPQAGPRPGA